MVKRGEIWLAKLDPKIGSEIQKTRPCVIISPPEMHDWLRTALIAPMTSGSRPASYRVPVSFEGRDGLILLDQMRAVDKSRLVKRLDALDIRTLQATLAVLRQVFSE